MLDFSSRDIQYLSGVGPQRAALFNSELDIYTLKDLLYFFPYKYVDRSRIYLIRELTGTMPYIQLRGRIIGFEKAGEGRKQRLIAHFSDGTGVVDLVWFKGVKYIASRYKLNEEYLVFDAVPHNVLMGIDGRLYFIDTQIKGLHGNIKNMVRNFM